QTGLIIEAIILTFGLAHRFNTYKNEREHLLLEVNRKQNEMTERIIETQEMERKKIADQLHDDIGSLLSVVSLQLSSLLENNRKSDSMIKLKKAGEVLETVSETVRSISHTLNPLAIEKYGFKNAIIDLFTNINLADRIDVEYIIIGFEGNINDEKNLINDLYRIIKELVNNVIKHSEASHCLIQVIEHEDCISIMVEDNGLGIRDDNKLKNGIGIENIRAKINYFEGHIEFSGMPDGGLLINIEIPLKSN
ncbi:MAG TPA: ATP-binding protein, partial [Daejeonella sp.]|nr:ATP-binding protein [Daejeonella sp.]